MTTENAKNGRIRGLLPKPNNEVCAVTSHAIAVANESKRGDDLVGLELRAILQRTAAESTTITYQGLARRLALPPPNTIHQLTVALERLMEEDAKARCPFIAALVISKVRNGLPAFGFFDCAHRLGRFVGDASGPEAWSFYAAELNAATHFWGASGEPGLKAIGI